MEIDELEFMFDPPERLKRRLERLASVNPKDFISLTFLPVETDAEEEGLKRTAKDTLAIAEKTVEIAEQLKGLKVNEIPPQLQDDLASVALEVLDKFKKPQPGDKAVWANTSNTEYLQYLRATESLCRTFCEKAIPIFSYLKLKTDRFQIGVEEAEKLVSTLRTKVKEELESFEAGKSELEGIVRVARETAAQAAVSYHAQEFGRIAQEHEESSKHWLIASIALVCITITVAFAALSFLPPLGGLSDPATVQRLVTKIVTVSILYYAVVWSAKNYKTHRHLAVVNLHRQSALKTFEAFVKASSSDEQTKNAVLLEATRCIFAPANTGYLGAEEENPSSRIIEIFKNVGGGASKS